MNRTDFIELLKRRLRKLPQDERNEAIGYYEQYFDDAGPENEQTVLSELGSPWVVASEVIANFAVKDESDSGKSAKNGFATVWMVILAVFASPIALPIALAVVLIAFAVILIIFSLILALGASGFAVAVYGIGCVIVGMSLISVSFVTTVFFIGLGLFSFGLGTALLTAAVLLSIKSFNTLAKSLGRFILRMRERGGKKNEVLA